jgi:hypothetical protein
MGWTLECSDEPSCSGATELVSYMLVQVLNLYINYIQQKTSIQRIKIAEPALSAQLPHTPYIHLTS